LAGFATPSRRPKLKEAVMVNAESGATAKRRILVVEDDADLGEMLAALLSMYGHQVAVATSGREALDLLSGPPVDMALVDLGLPDLDGREVARQMRAGADGRALQLVALTGADEEEDRRAALAAGFDEYLVKPIEPDQLLALVGE
jgi:DNA-binding response OmpR family regulator